MNLKINLLFASATLLAVMCGCTPEMKSTSNAEGNTGVFKVASQHDTSLMEYVVDPPDEIVVRAPNVKEIDGQKQVVRADGKIALNLLGEVKVSGKTPAQIQAQLVEIANKYYTNPDIKIEVTANSKFYTIFGRGASTGGRKPYTGNDCLVKALSEAGINENSWPEQVRLVRPKREGREAAVAIIDFKHMNETGDTRQNYALQEGDILYLPDSPLASFNFKASQVLGPISGATAVTGSVRTP